MGTAAASHCTTAEPSSAECPIMNNGQEAYPAGFNLSYVAQSCANPRAGTKRFGLSRVAPTSEAPTGSGGIYIEWETRLTNVDVYITRCS